MAITSNDAIHFPARPRRGVRQISGSTNGPSAVSVSTPIQNGR